MVNGAGSGGFDAETEMVGVFEFAEITNASNEIVEPHKRYSQHTGFGSHGLAIADIKRCKRHHMVHVEGVNADAILKFDSSQRMICQSGIVSC